MIIQLVERSMANHTNDKHINTNPILQSTQLLKNNNSVGQKSLILLT